MVFFFKVVIVFVDYESANFYGFNGFFYLCFYVLSTLIKCLLNSRDLWQLLFMYRIDKMSERNQNILVCLCLQIEIQKSFITIVISVLTKPRVFSFGLGFFYYCAYVRFWLKHRNVVLSYWRLPVIKIWNIFCLQILDCCCLQLQNGRKRLGLIAVLLSLAAVTFFLIV